MSERSYVDRIAVAYFMAPSESEEERLLDEALQLACTRHGVSIEEVSRRVSNEHADVIDAYQEHDASGGPSAASDVLTERSPADCQCGAPLPVHLLFALHSHHCSCGCVWVPNEGRGAFLAREGAS